MKIKTFFWIDQGERCRVLEVSRSAYYAYRGGSTYVLQGQKQWLADILLFNCPSQFAGTIDRNFPENYDHTKHYRSQLIRLLYYQILQEKSKSHYQPHPARANFFNVNYKKSIAKNLIYFF